MSYVQRGGKKRNQGEIEIGREKNLTKISAVLGVQIFIQSGDFGAVVCTFSLLRANESVGARTSRRKCRE